MYNMETSIELNEKSEIIMSVDLDKWFIRISCDGIKFNHEEYPNVSLEGFAKAFCDLLEKNYKVKFIKTEDNQNDRFQ